MFAIRFLLLSAFVFAVRLVGQNCEDRSVVIKEVHEGNIVHLFLETTNCLDITLTLTPKLENMRALSVQPSPMETKGRQRVEVATFVPIDSHKPWRYNYTYNWRYGSRSGPPDPAPYQLPFEINVRHKLIQGYGGNFSHQRGTANECAHDWDLAQGSLVLAARDGAVVGIRQDSNSGGTGSQFLNCANYVIIRHSDGTYAEYLHLQQNDVLVKLGQQVVAGQSIARSGNTGFSSRPHLHFAVFRTIDGSTRESLPVKFTTKEGETMTLIEGQKY